MTKQHLFLLQDALSILGKKWTIEIFYHMRQKQLRYSDFQKLLPKISTKMLTHRLNELQELQLVTKIITTKENAVYYSLTPRCINLGDLFYELSLFSLLKMDTKGSVSRGLVVGKIKRDIAEFYNKVNKY